MRRTSTGPTGVERVRGDKKLSLGLLIGQAAGGHPAAWLHPKANGAGSLPAHRPVLHKETRMLRTSAKVAPAAVRTP
jgi:hypothetical protein